MKQSKLDKINGAWDALAYQFPRWPTTYSKCQTCNVHDARGGSGCTLCAFNKLKELVSEEEAQEVLSNMRALNNTWFKLYEKYYDHD